MAQMFTPVEHDPFADVGAVPKPGQSVAPGLTPQMLSEQVLGASRATVSALRPYWMDLEPTDAQIAERGDAMQRGISQPGKVPPTTGLDPGPAAAVDALGWLPVGGAAKIGAAAASKLAPFLSIFAGPAAKTADRAALELAQHMAERGMNKRQIWDATGWFTGADGKWRFEIPDTNLSVIPGKGTGILERLNSADKFSAIDHPDLYEAYPQLMDLEHDIKMVDPKMRGFDLGGVYKPPMEGRPGIAAFPPNVNPFLPEGLPPIFARAPKPAEIEVTEMSQAMLRSVTGHELMHGVQKLEGFAPGGNVENFAIEAMKTHPDMDYLARENLAYENYRRVAGEVEARNVQQRLNMTPAQRRAKPPWETEDTPRDLQIVRGANGQSYRLIPVDHDPFAQGPVP